MRDVGVPYFNRDCCDVRDRDRQARAVTGRCVEGGVLAMIASVTVTESCGEGGMPCSGATASLAVRCCDGGGPSWTVCYCNGGVPSMPSMTVLDHPSRRPVRRWLRGVVDSALITASQAGSLIHGMTVVGRDWNLL